MDDDIISRHAAIRAICEKSCLSLKPCGAECPEVIALKELPSAEPERKKGKWTEKHHVYSDEEYVIEEWQSCRCSECGRYDTRPYMYYFSEPRFCSWCGADMRGEADE